MKRKYGLIGEVLGHSYSPQLHALLGGYEYALMPLPPGELDAFLRKGDFDGLNVTIPYKRAVLPYCAELSPEAREIGSVNTLIRRKDGTLYGDNTDAYGFAKMAERAGIRFADQKALVLGSGGTSRAVCYIIRRAGGQPVVISRKGKDNYANLEQHRDAALLVNTTPVGMAPHQDAAPVEIGDDSPFPGLTGVLDVIYHPLRTRLLLQAQKRSLRHSGGLAMLVWQAAKASELFTGQPLSAAQVQWAYAALRRQVTSIVLIGMPGCGKSTVGKALAALAGMPLVDIDEEIEKESGQSIPNIITNEGEGRFREMESAMLERCARDGGKIVVTGGGAVLAPHNREYLCQNGFVAHITRDMAVLPLVGRPLSTSREGLWAMWEKRAPMYRACADASFANESTPHACAQAIWEAYNEAICD